MLPLVLWAVLQSGPGQPVQIVNPLLADCSGERNTKSCRSFNELVEGKDKHLLGNISEDAYVCFRSEEDVFIVISFLESSSEPQLHMVAYERFSDGISDNFELAYGSWGKKPDGSHRFTNTKPPPSKAHEIEGSALISGEEVNFYYQFKNMSGNTTQYSIQVRRSTLRFSETYEFPDGKDKGHQSINHTGYCVSYESAK